MELNSFVYRWRQISTNKWYIGYHKGAVDDGYTCSSDVVALLIELYPEDWERRVLRHGTHKQMVALEEKLLRRLNARSNPKSYNKHNGNGRTTTGRTPGTKNKNSDLNMSELEKLDAKELIELYKNVKDRNDRRRLFKIDKYILGKVLT